MEPTVGAGVCSACLSDVWLFCCFFSYVAVICILSFCSSNTFPLLSTKILYSTDWFFGAGRGIDAPMRSVVLFKRNEMGSAFTVEAPCCWCDWGRQGPQLLSRGAWMCHRLSERIPLQKEVCASIVECLCQPACRVDFAFGILVAAASVCGGREGNGREKHIGV